MYFEHNLLSFLTLKSVNQSLSENQQLVLVVLTVVSVVANNMSAPRTGDYPGDLIGLYRSCKDTQVLGGAQASTLTLRTGGEKGMSKGEWPK